MEYGLFKKLRYHNTYIMFISSLIFHFPLYEYIYKAMDVGWQKSKLCVASVTFWLIEWIYPVTQINHCNVSTNANLISSKLFQLPLWYDLINPGNKIVYKRHYWYLFDLVIVSMGINSPPNNYSSKTVVHGSSIEIRLCLHIEAETNGAHFTDAILKCMFVNANV